MTDSILFGCVTFHCTMTTAACAKRHTVALRLGRQLHDGGENSVMEGADRCASCQLGAAFRVEHGGKATSSPRVFRDLPPGTRVGSEEVLASEPVLRGGKAYLATRCTVTGAKHSRSVTSLRMRRKYVPCSDLPVGERCGSYTVTSVPVRDGEGRWRLMARQPDGSERFMTPDGLRNARRKAKRPSARFGKARNGISVQEVEAAE